MSLESMTAPARLVLDDGTEFAVVLTSVVATSDAIDVTSAHDEARQYVAGPPRLEFSGVAVGTGRKVLDLAPLPARAVRAISLAGVRQ